MSVDLRPERSALPSLPTSMVPPPKISDPPPAIFCPAGCGKRFMGKNPRLGVQRHLKIYAKQWKKHEEVSQIGGVGPKLTKDLDEVEAHWKEHDKSIYHKYGYK